MVVNFYSSLVLLVGPPRSGTTWLNREICKGGNTFDFLPECTLLTQQVELYNRTLNYCDQQRFAAYFSNKDNLMTYYRENVIRLLDLVARINNKPDAKILVFKDPELTLYLADIEYLFPQHKLIVLIRDPRDVLASMKKVAARKRESWDMFEKATWLYTYYYKIENYLQQASHDKMFVRYEDLVLGGLSSVRAFLNQLPAGDASSGGEMMVLREKLNASDPYFSELYLLPTTQKKIGSYKEILSASEIDHIETVYSGVMQRWGY